MGFALAYNMAGGNELTWDESLDEDFMYFNIYRGMTEDFEPYPTAIVHQTSSTSWTDAITEGWRYYYKITAVDYNGNESTWSLPGTVTGEDGPAVPTAFALAQNYPNPFNPITSIRYDIASSTNVRIDIYNVNGQLVRTLVDRAMAPGSYETAWDGKDTTGNGVASGVYFYRLLTEEYKATKKMLLLR